MQSTQSERYKKHSIVKNNAQVIDKLHEFRKDIEIERMSKFSKELAERKFNRQSKIMD